MKHIFVFGLDDFNLKELQSVHDADQYEFHGLVDYDIMVNPKSYDIDAILADARATLNAAPSVDGIIGHWDFPTTSLLPILRREWGLPTSSLESALYCENKYWTRIANQEAIPESCPDFQALDPFSKDPVADLDMEYPFWLKPTTAFSSYLGFRIETEDQYRKAMQTIADNIRVFSDPFDRVVDFCEQPDKLPKRGHGPTALAESIIGGRLCTLEGYIYDGEVVVYGILDSLRAANNVSFISYQYPSVLPEGVQNRMRIKAEKILKHIELDHTPFNMEFFWDEQTDRIWLLEINPRISKSHCAIFQIATGASHHEVAINLSLDRRPDFPRDEGRYPMAAKFMPRVFGDAQVLRVPSREQIDAIRRQYPELLVNVGVEEGQYLSELRGQDSYSFEIADLFLGGADEMELHAKFHEIMEMLDFRFSEVLPTNWQVETPGQTGEPPSLRA